jgi:hypothetical protein
LAERRWKVAHDARLNEDKIEWFKELRRITSSPGARWSGRRSRRWSGTGDRRWPGFGMPSSLGTIEGFLACLAWQGGRWSHGGASEIVVVAQGCLYRQRRSSPERGFRWLVREDERERGRRKIGVPRVLYGGWQPFIDVGERRVSSWCDEEAVGNRATGRAPLSCLPAWRRRRWTGTWAGSAGFG